MPPKGKFDGIDFLQAEVLALTPELAEVLGPGFRCKLPEFATFWRKGRIAREVKTHVCRCWVIHHEQALVGYITLLTDKVEMLEPPLIDEGVKYKTIPSVKIGLLAADMRAKGVGTRLIEWASDYVIEELGPRVGVRFLSVDAFYDRTRNHDSSGFYAKMGFEFIRAEEGPETTFGSRGMFIDLGRLMRLVESAEPTTPQAAPPA